MNKAIKADGVFEEIINRTILLPKTTDLELGSGFNTIYNKIIIKVIR